MLTLLIGGSPQTFLSSAYLTSQAITPSAVGVFTTANAAFDGTTSKSYTACAVKSPSISGYGNIIGVYYGGIYARITRFDLYGPSDDGIIGNGTSNGLRLLGSNDGVTWVVLWEGAYPSGTSVHVSVDSGITLEAYKYHALDIGGNGTNALRPAQVQFWGNFV